MCFVGVCCCWWSSRFSYPKKYKVDIIFRGEALIYHPSVWHEGSTSQCFWALTLLPTGWRSLPPLRPSPPLPSPPSSFSSFPLHLLHTCMPITGGVSFSLGRSDSRFETRVQHLGGTSDLAKCLVSASFWCDYWCVRRVFKVQALVPTPSSHLFF